MLNNLFHLYLFTNIFCFCQNSKRLPLLYNHQLFRFVPCYISFSLSLCSLWYEIIDICIDNQAQLNSNSMVRIELILNQVLTCIDRVPYFLNLTETLLVTFSYGKLVKCIMISEYNQTQISCHELSNLVAFKGI